MQQEQFSPQDSLRVIQSMLQKTREEIRGNDVFFLLWGWIVFAACTGQFLLKHVFEYPRHYLVWWLIAVGIVGNFVLIAKKKKQTAVKTYIDESMRFLWTGMGISFFVLSMIITREGWGSTVFPFFMMMYGLGTFVSGCLLRFRPFVVGGILSWTLAIISAYLSYDWQILFAAVAILVSYLIPAYLLRHKSKTLGRV